MSVVKDFLALPRFCTISETSDFLGVSKTTVRRYIELGYLDTWALESGRRRVLRDSIGVLCGIDMQSCTSD